MLARSRRDGQHGGREASEPMSVLATLVAAGAGVPSPVDVWVRIVVLVVVLVVMASARHMRQLS